MKSKNQKKTKMIIKQSKKKYNNQRYLQNGGRLITIIFNGRRIPIMVEAISCVEQTIFCLKDHIERLLDISIEQRFSMGLFHDTLGECDDWINLRLFNDPITFTLSIGPTLDPTSQVLKIGDVFNIQRYPSLISQIPIMRQGADHVKEIQYRLIMELLDNYSKRLSELRSIIDNMVKPPRVSRHGEFRINIKSLTNTICQVYVQSTDTVESLKIAIQEKANIGVLQQRLVFNQRALEHDRTIESYGIIADSTVHIILRTGHPCLCGRYVCQSCIMDRMMSFVNAPHDTNDINQGVKSRFAHAIYSMQSEIIHQTHVLERLRSLPHDQQSRPVSSSGPVHSLQQPPIQSDTRLIFNMGFPQSQVLEALRLTNNNEEEAINLLLEE